MTSSGANGATTKDLVMTRAFDAPLELVWRAWSESAGVMGWWGPRGFTTPVARMDFREGGTSLVCMRAPNGQDFYNTWAHRSIEPFERLEFVLDWADAAGKRTDPSALGLPPDMPRDVRHVVTFASTRGGTEMTVTEYGYTSEEHFAMSQAGLAQCLDKMAEMLAAQVRAAEATSGR